MSVPSRSGDDDASVPPRPRDDHAWPSLDPLRLGCIACDPDGRVRRWNAAAAALLGESLLRRPLAEWPDAATFRGDDGRVLSASALPFGSSAASEEALVERLLVVERPGSPTLTLAAVVQPWSEDGPGGTLTFIRSAERARRIADAGRERSRDLERRLDRQIALVRTARVAGSADEDRTRLPRLLEQLAADLPADLTGLVLTAEPDELAADPAAAARAGEVDAAAIDRVVLGTPAEPVADEDGQSVLRRLHESGAGEWIRSHRRPLTVASAALDPFESGVAAWAAVPLAGAGATSLGVLYAVHAQPRQYDANDLAYLEAVADQAAGAIVRTRLIDRLRSQTEELTAHRDRLEQLVAERTRDLAESHARLRVADRLAAIGTFTAGLGHDMENVLFPLRCRLDAIEPDQVPAEGPLTATIDATRHALGFLRDLADGLRLFARDPLDGPADASTPLSAWWPRVAPLIRHAIPADIELTASIPADLPAARLPAAGLTQAILNLVVNAADACAAGGRIEVEAGQDPDDRRRLAVRVRDDGRGMSPEVAAQAFDPFFSTRTRTVSTGLGLWLVHQVVDRAGGDIQVETAPGRGTCITLHLPIASSDPASGGDAAAPPHEEDRSRPAVTVRIDVADPRRRAWIMPVVQEAGGRLTDDRDEEATLVIRDAPADPADHAGRREVRLGGPPPADAPADADADADAGHSSVRHVPDPDDLAMIRRLVGEAIADAAAESPTTPPASASTRPESDR